MSTELWLQTPLQAWAGVQRWVGNGLYFDGKEERKVEGALVPSNCNLIQTSSCLSKFSTGETEKKTEENKEMKCINENINVLKFAFCL